MADAHGAMPAPHLTHRRCRECEDVYWHASDGDTCWCCGGPGDPTTPRVPGNQYGAGRAITAREWSEVRRRVL